MRLAILSDIHANAEALRAVLADLRRVCVDMVVNLGDIVGYSTQPGETLAMLRAEGIPSVYGDHELMVNGLLDGSSCGSWAAQVACWTRGVLSRQDLRYLAALPGALRLRRDVLFVHSRLGDPVRRMLRPGEFAEHCATIRQQAPHCSICFTGHTHRPGVVEVVPETGAVWRDDAVERASLRPGRFHFVNPGSVGYPRDGDPRASYAVYDSDRRVVTMRRVAYRVGATMRLNAKNGIRADLGAGRSARVPRPSRTALRAIAGRLAQLVG